MAELFGRCQRDLPQPVENVCLACQCPVSRRRQIALQLGKGGCGETHRLRRRLAMDEPVILHQLVSMRAAHVDMIAKHVVVLHLQRCNASRGAIILLQGCNQPAAFIAQGAQLVQRAVIALPDKPAVTRQQWQIIAQRRGQIIGHRGSRHYRIIQHWQILGRGQCGLRQCGLRKCGLRLSGIGHQFSPGQHTARQRIKIARPAMPQRQAGQRPIDIGNGFHTDPQLITQITRRGKPGHQIKPPVDHRGFGKWRGNPLGQQARTSSSHRMVDGKQQAAFALT